MHTIGVLSSGVPNTFRHIAKAVETGEIPNIQVGIVVCDRPDMPILDVAQELNLTHHYIPRQQHDFEAQARILLLEADVDLVLLIGYLPKVGATLLETFPGRILNSHSGPLPRFGGKGMIQNRTQTAVLAAGVTYSGPTIHLVDAEYDHGQILGHWPVMIRPADTPESLNTRCNLAGRQLYVSVLRDYIYRLDRPELFG
jgi:phosphoribosylglycinamide formyltransferase 1